MTPWKRAVYAVLCTVSVSLFVKACGLQNVLFYNKDLLSVFVLISGFIFCGFRGVVLLPDKERAIEFVLGFLLALTEATGYYLRIQYEWKSTFWDIRGALIILLMAVVITPVFANFFCWLFRKEFRKGIPKETGLVRRFFIPWALIFAAYMPALLAFYPGIYCYDMPWQWQQYVEGSFSTHHPLLHTLFAGGLLELGRSWTGSANHGLLLHSLVQTFLLSGALAWGIQFLIKRGTSKKVTLGVFLYFVLFPFYPVLAISTTKDVLFGAFLLVFITGILDIAEDIKLSGQASVVKTCVYCGFAVLACLFRNNMVYAMILVFVLVLLVLLISLKTLKNTETGKTAWRRISGTLACIAAIVAVSLSAFAGLKMSLHAEPGSNAEKLSVPMQQMARAYVCHLDEFPEQEKNQLLYYFDESSLLGYQYWCSDVVKAGIRIDRVEENKKDFIRTWYNIGKRYPGEYLAATLYNTMGLWYMGGDSSCYLSYESLDSIDESRKIEMQSFLPVLRDYYRWFNLENLEAYMPVLSLAFFTSFYAWLVLIAAALAVKRKRIQILFACVILLSYMVTLFFGPCVLVRYMAGIMISVPFLLVAAFEKAPGTAG